MIAGSGRAASPVAGRIRHAGGREALAAQPAGIAAAAGPALRRRPGSRTRSAPKSTPSAAPRRMISALLRSISGVRIAERLASSTPARVARLAMLLERRDEFRPAVRIAGVVDGVDADEDVVRAEHLGPGQRERQEHRVARRHVGDRDAAASRASGTAMPRSVSAEPPNAARSMCMTRCSTAPSARATRAAACQFRRVPLAVGEAERVAAKALGARDREAGGRIEPARDQHDGRPAATGAVARDGRSSARLVAPEDTCAAAPAAARRAGRRGSTRRGRAARPAPSSARTAPGTAAARPRSRSRSRAHS